MKPILKWVGGKRQLLPRILPLIPPHSRYFEPFFGGGAVGFALADRFPDREVTIGDANPELTNFYRIVKNCPNEFLEVIQSYQEDHCEEFYLKIRSLDRGSGFASLSHFCRATRFYYLVKTGFNGLWRVNSKGQNNVPYGGDKPVGWNIIDAENFAIVFQTLQSWNICEGDFQETIADATDGDLVYLDPPYIPASPTASFTTYSKGGFGELEQRRLADCLHALTSRNVKFILSNSDTELSRSLYDRYFIHQVKARRAINSDGLKRGAIGELLVTNFR